MVAQRNRCGDNFDNFALQNTGLFWKVRHASLDEIKHINNKDDDFIKINAVLPKKRQKGACQVSTSAVSTQKKKKGAYPHSSGNISWTCHRLQLQAAAAAAAAPFR